jgi:hypothetical protein
MMGNKSHPQRSFRGNTLEFSAEVPAPVNSTVTIGVAVGTPLSAPYALAKFNTVSVTKRLNDSFCTNCL